MPPKLSLKRFFTPKRLAATLICTAILTIGLVLVDHIFTVKQVRIIGEDEGVSIIGINELVGENLLFLSESDTAKKIYTYNSTLKNVSIVKEYPGTVQLFIAYESPLALLKVNTGAFFLSPAGRIIRKSHTIGTALPVINYYQQLNYNAYQTGDAISYQDITTGLFFLEKLLDLGFKIDSIDIKGVNMIGLVSENKKFLFTTEKDKGMQEYQLETLVKQLHVEGRDFVGLDFRFDKPVVQLTEK